jgi:hypothetical protein
MAGFLRDTNASVLLPFRHIAPLDQQRDSTCSFHEGQARGTHATCLTMQQAIVMP